VNKSPEKRAMQNCTTLTLPATRAVRFWRDPELAALEVCDVVKSTHAFPNHSHDDIYAFSVMREGGSYCRGERGDFVAPGQIALINPGQVHSGVPRRGVEKTYRMIYVQVGWLREAAADLGQFDAGFPEFSPMVVDNPPLAALVWRMSGAGRCRACRLEKETAMLEAFGALLSGHGGVRAAVREPARDARAVSRAKELLAEDLERKLTLEELARAVGLSRYHLLRVFKAGTGVPPHAYRTQRRVDAAKGMLRRGMPPAEVAAATGFTDQSHFANTFKRYTAATPSQYASL